MKSQLRKLLLLVGLLSGAVFTGCFEDDPPLRTAGGDDYPNGMEPLGKKAAMARSDSADWNGFDSLPKSAPGLYDTVTVPDTVPDTSKSGQAPAPKRAAARASADTLPMGGVKPSDTLPMGGVKPSDTLPMGGVKPSDTLPIGGVKPLDTLVTRVIDTAKGTVETVRTQVSDSGSKRVDSTVFVPADPAKPGAVAGVNQVTHRLISADSSRVDLWKFSDADGDGLLTPKAGGKNLASIENTTTLAGKVVVKSSRVIAAGADLDFNARGDNRVMSSQLLRLVAGDTVEILRLLDADGDSAILDFAKEVNLVDLIEVKRFPAGNDLVSVTRQVRLEAFKDSARNFPIRYTEKRVLSDGAVIEILARGTGADSSFLAGAEAHWTETRWPAIADTLERGQRAFRVRLGAVPGAFAANVLLGLRVEEAYRKGFRDFAFDFRCETPVADGRWPAAGEVLAWLTLESGARVVFNGSAEADGLRGTVTDADSTSAAVRFDLSGAIVRP